MDARLSNNARLKRTLGQLRQTRNWFNQGRFLEQDRRRAEDRIRDEHHDAHAKTIRPESSQQHAAAGVRIRIIRPIPAPMMDGFDVRHFRFGHVYQLDRDNRTAKYLLIAGYAVRVDADDVISNQDSGR